MEPVQKELNCPSCGKPSTVRVMPGATEYRWQCPECKKLQKAAAASADAAAAH
jgi:ribosomal protein L37AE/L43A